MDGINLFEDIDLKWFEIESIKLENLRIVINTKIGEEKEIKLDELKYKEVLEVKSELKNFADAKNIKIV